MSRERERMYFREQVALACALKPDHLKDAVAALSLKLTAEEVAALEGP
jgi:aryl-alcohol dehydrogenase-like predicted oxidoreductase